MKVVGKKYGKVLEVTGVPMRGKLLENIAEENTSGKLVITFRGR